VADAPKPRLRHLDAQREHQSLFDTFACKEGKRKEVTKFLQRDALDEQDRALSRTTLFVADPVERCDAFVTLSAASYNIPTDELGIPPRFIPGVMIDWVGVHAYHGKGLGFYVFGWIEREILALRRTAPFGIRLLLMAVRAENWRLVQHYATVWRFEPIPMHRDPNDQKSPLEKLDPTGDRPSWLSPGRFIHMYYDLLSRKPSS
jgi:hypothetical protein